MYDKFVSYKDIFDVDGNVPEKLDRKTSDPDPCIVEDLVVMLKMDDLYNQMDNFIETQQNKLDELDDQMNYSYNELGERNDYEYRKNRSKHIVENTKRKEEVVLMKEKDKIDTLTYIKNKGLVIDRIRFLDDHDVSIVYLSATLWDVERWDTEDDDEPWVYVFPEFMLNASWHIEASPDEDSSVEVDIDQIKEIIVDETKYIFML